MVKQDRKVLSKERQMSSSNIPTKFTVCSHEQKETKGFIRISGLVLVIAILYYIDPFVRTKILWFVGGLAIVFLMLDTSSYHREIRTSVSVYPIGVQRTTQINSKQVDYPLLPRESIQDCILIEHIGVWSVSTQLVFRLKSSSKSALIPVFPNSKLSFSQCQTLANQIQTALNET